MIVLQSEPFDVGREIAALCRDQAEIGAIATFLGLVRDKSGDKRLKAMTLEHYPGMTEAKLTAIEREAHRRWPLQASLIIHRYGRLLPGEAIVLVVTASSHRAAALEACAFLIDWLKTKAPFWKLEEALDGSSNWVEAKDDDLDLAARWEQSRT